MDSMIRLRLVLTGILVVMYLMVLVAQARAETRDDYNLRQGEHSAYFSFNDTDLSPEARHQLNIAIENVKSLGHVKGARVVGFADHIGTPSYNEKLSRKRAEAVRNYLVSRGIINASVADTRWFGDSLPATDCRDDLAKPALITCLQNDRRVDVEFDYATQIAKAQ
jgi:outer membrane protein OmpA-like peptidoglycan-associated protein